MTQFLEIDGPEDEEGLERLLDLGRLDDRDMGRVLVTFRAWPGPYFWVPFGLLWLLTGVAVVTAPDRGDDGR